MVGRVRSGEAPSPPQSEGPLTIQIIPSPRGNSRTIDLSSARSEKLHKLLRGIRRILPRNFAGVARQ